MKPHDMFRRGLAVLFLAACGITPASADAVLEGAQAHLEMMRGLHPSVRARIRVLADTAVFNALQVIESRRRPQGPAASAEPEPSSEAAVAAARWTVFALQPEMPADRVRQAYRDALATLPDTPAKTLGIAVGQQSGAAVLAARPENDRHEAAAAARFDPGAPPHIESDPARCDLAEVKTLGARDSITRSADQTAATLFWYSIHDADLLPMLAAIARARQFTPLDNARLLATWSVSEYRASLAIGAFKGKYRHHPRPDAAIGDTSWAPLLRTPAHPEYPSGGAVTAGMYQALLEHWHPGSGVPLEMANRALGVTRRWASARALGAELAAAPVWGGIHYRGTTEVSHRIGHAIAQEVLATGLQPLTR